MWILRAKTPGIVGLSIASNSIINIGLWSFGINIGIRIHIMSSSGIIPKI